MAEAISFSLAVFVGWLVLDFVKHKRITKINIFVALLNGIIAGVAWYVLDFFLS